MESKTKRMTAMAMLVAMAYIMAMIGRVPVVLFLKYDPKDIIITLGGLMYGPLTACIISVVVSLIQMVTTSSTGIWGCIMNIISTCAFSCVAAFIYKKKRTLSGAVIGLLAGIISMASVMLVWNYLITCFVVCLITYSCGHIYNKCYKLFCFALAIGIENAALIYCNSGKVNCCCICRRNCRITVCKGLLAVKNCEFDVVGNQ